MADKPMIEKTVPDEPKPKAEGVGTYFEWFKDKEWWQWPWPCCTRNRE